MGSIGAIAAGAGLVAVRDHFAQVNAVGGELDIEDTPGGGATMVITLPLAAP